MLVTFGYNQRQFAGKKRKKKDRDRILGKKAIQKRYDKDENGQNAVILNIVKRRQALEKGLRKRPQQDTTRLNK